MNAMDGKSVRPPVGQPQSPAPKPAGLPKAKTTGPAATALQALQASADKSSHARKLRQLKKLAYLRPNAGALRQLSGDERLRLQLMRKMAAR